MKSNNSPNRGIWVVSVHDMRPGGDGLSFDTRDVLLCLGSEIHNYVWALMDLDCTGEEAQAFCDAVQASRRSKHALVVSRDELIAAFNKIEQTIDATIIGIPQRVYTPKVLEAISDLSLFPQSPAELIIRAVDSSFFEVITKNHDHVDALKKCFKDVRDEDPSNYFAASANR